MTLQSILYSNLDKSTYQYFTIHNIAKFQKKSKTPYLDFFNLYSHKKLMYFQFSITTKFYNFSVGQILRKRIKKLKFFKKSVKNIGLTINVLNKKVHKYLKSIYLFFCKNFTIKHFVWIKKMFTIIKPKIEYTVITASWNPIIKKKRRIKKKIFRNLFKNVTKV